MNDFEQVLIRLGLDAKAVESGLTRMTSYVKGWASNMASEIQSGIVGLVGVGFIMHKAEQVFEAIKEKALLINRLQKETGTSTNMVQSMMRLMGGVGEGFEQLARPLGKFALLIGQAKQGIPEARQKLVEWGIAAKDTNWATFNATTGINNLSLAYDKLGSAEEKAALLQAVYSKGWQAMSIIFEQGHDKIAEMDKGSFFTKLTPAALGNLQGIQTAWETVKATSVATIGNIMAYTVGIIPRSIASMITVLHEKERIEGFSVGRRLEYVGHMLKYIFAGPNEEQQKHISSLETQQELLKGNLDILQKLNEQHRLENEIGDRTKTTVGALADRYMELRGKGMPHGLKSIYSVTPAMASAYQIRNLELDAEAANAKGDYGRASNLQSRADELRKNNQALKSTERDPMEQVRDKLAILTESLERSGALPVNVLHMPQAH